ncbi:NDT80/PhoG-like DNA-binding family protein [Aspergillus melleus]|uniref:NDT80/PhoG-like DNA-binding family protein n=1 Tax=Aspergillus melleus TaxID=138277 RepID=UPI001E8E4EC5|nr:uncharacterized protein LDX57_009812 [Aspergillus melleus]KAH8432170.1 hypothetical protein LDX57_009812 [Aspergillus melleus]
MTECPTSGPIGFLPCKPESSPHHMGSRASIDEGDMSSQPPAGMSSTVQPQGTGGAGIMRDSYPATYTLQRSTFPSLSSLSDMSRISPYTTTPRALDGTVDRPQSLLLGQPSSMMFDSRLHNPTDAPPFSDTAVLQFIVSGTQTIKPEIQAKIHKGFFLVDDKWTCYRRNYFSVSCSFSLVPFTHAPLFLKFTDHSTERILSFAMSISAIVNAQYGEVRELVQHTPKRDKQSERKPGKVVLQPCQPPPLVLGHSSTGIGSQHGFSLTTSPPSGMSVDYAAPYSSAPQPAHPPTQHTFERIQFQKATANNGKRRAQQQYYNLVVELHAEISNPVGGEDTQWVKIARKLSHPMVVRGRSPGHYKDGRRDSSTSMDPNGGRGGSGDGVLPPGIGPTRSHLMMSYDTPRSGPPYGRADYHHMPAPDRSSLSESPHISSSSSSAFDIETLNDSSMNPMDSIKSTSSMDSYHDSGFGAMNRKPESQYRFNLPPFGYDAVSKNSEEPGTSYPESFDSMISMMPHEQHQHESSLHHFKPPMKITPPGYHHTTGGYDPACPARTSDRDTASYPKGGKLK